MSFALMELRRINPRFASARTARLRPCAGGNRYVRLPSMRYRIRWCSIALAVWLAAGLSLHLCIEHVCCGHPTYAAHTAAVDGSCCGGAGDTCHTEACDSIPGDHGSTYHDGHETPLNTSRNALTAKVLASRSELFVAPERLVSCPPADFAATLPTAHASRIESLRAPPTA